MSAIDAKSGAGRALRGGLAALFVLVSAGPAAAWPLRAAALQTDAGTTFLRLTAMDPAEKLPHDVFALEDPHRIVIDLFGADVPLAVAGLAASTRGEGPVRDVRWSVWKNEPDGQIVRYVLETDGAMEGTVREAPGELVVALAPAGAGGGASGPEIPAPAPRSDLAAAAPAPEDPSPAPLVPVLPAAASGTAAPFAAPWPARPSSRPAFPSPQDEAPPLGRVDAGGAEGASRPSDSRPMNLDVQGADIRTVLRSIAEYGGANIVADRDVEGPVTVRLQQVPWREALDIVCQSAALIAVDREKVIRVATVQTFQAEGLDRESAARKKEELQPLVTRVLPIRYASSKELLAAISFALSPRGSASVDERTNAILVNDIEPRLEQIEMLVSRLDTETRQVEIEARLVDVDRTVSRQLGVDWSLDNLHSDAERISGSVGVTEPISGAASGQVRVGLVRDFGVLDATIEALERKNEASLISNPKITTVNNRKARILVGKEVPLIVLDESGNATTELKKVGITLEVTPYINSENRITMDIHPEVSDLSSQATVQGGVVFNTTLADTRVMVNNGETAVIGGLVRQGETEFHQGIPILRSIPLLGALFSSSDRRKESRELLIFISPRIVEGMAEKN